MSSAVDPATYDGHAAGVAIMQRLPADGFDAWAEGQRRGHEGLWEGPSQRRTSRAKRGGDSTRRSAKRRIDTPDLADLLSQSSSSHLIVRVGFRAL